MACSLPHSVEEIQEYVWNQFQQEDPAHQEAIIGVIMMFEQSKEAKEALKKICKMH